MSAPALSMREPEPVSATPDLVPSLRALAVRLLSRMYAASDRLFVFRLRRDGDRLVAEGRSHRYTAIVLIGLANEDKAIGPMAS